MYENLYAAVRKTNALACLECGKCTSVCPVSRFSQEYSPRLMLNKSVKQDFENLFRDYDLWSCLTCKRCDQVCPSAISYIELTQILRSRNESHQFRGQCSHSGVLETLQKMMTATDLKQNRLDWLSADLDITTDQGEILYFVGCAPYFDSFFTSLELSTLDAAISSIKILNHLGIKPVLLPQERCCGHDLYWNGDTDNFKMLAERNLEMVAASGCKTILFSCAECQSAFQNLYRDNGFKVPWKLQHMSQFIAEKIAAGALELQPSYEPVTFQDPCRLGRHLDEYVAPRTVLQSNGSDNLVEMAQHGKGALCCGVSAWMNCDGTTRKIQNERLRQARETGARTLAVACPKCHIHLQCTRQHQDDPDCSLSIQDISTIILRRINS
ncbi:MAG: (Fe-S)-binding protein [Candidatus Neomarinimicrobiota bacterium]